MYGTHHEAGGDRVGITNTPHMRRRSVRNRIAHLYSKGLNKEKYAPVVADVGTRANNTVVLRLCKCLFITITLRVTCQGVQWGTINLNFEDFLVFNCVGVAKIYCMAVSKLKRTGDPKS